VTRLAALLFFSTAGCAACSGAPPAPPPPRPEPRITVVVAPGELALPRERLQRWVDESAAMIRETFGAFPVDELELTLEPRGNSRGIHDGTTRGMDGRARIQVGVGGHAGERTLERDWVLVHEMVHLAIPNLPPVQHWFEEGAATYLEPFARARGGKLSEQEVWRELTSEYAQGLPRAGEGGLEDTRTWARTYYGGALFCLVADIGIARATHGTKSLRDAFAGTLARGASIRQHSELEQFAAELDSVLGVEVVAALHAQWAHTPVQVDLAALWKELGVVREGQEIRFDDSAPLAGWRAKLASP
jgi:hypothetical protein